MTFIKDYAVYKFPFGWLQVEYIGGTVISLDKLDEERSGGHKTASNMLAGLSYLWTNWMRRGPEATRQRLRIAFSLSSRNIYNGLRKQTIAKE